MRQGASAVLRTYTITINKPVIVACALSVQPTEAGGTATFLVRLEAVAPLAGVTVAVANQDTSEGSAAITFNAASWNTAQMVTVTDANDNIHDGTVSWMCGSRPGVTHPPTTGTSSRDVTVSTTDDDRLTVR